MDVVTHANGVVQSSDATATITNVSAGKLEEIRFLDGDYVKKGETLFIVDTEELMQQKEQSKQEIVKLEKEIEILQAYLEALDGNADALQKCLDNEFYDEFATRYQAVQLNCNTVHANASAQRSQYQSSIGSLDISIQTAVGDKSKLNQMLSDIRNRENNFSVEEVYYHAAVEEYINRYNFTAGQYDSQITQLRETEKSVKEIRL